MNASNPDQSRDKKVGRPNRTDDRESITDNDNNKKYVTGRSHWYSAERC